VARNLGVGEGIDAVARGWPIEVRSPTPAKAHGVSYKAAWDAIDAMNTLARRAAGRALDGWPRRRIRPD